MSGCYGLLEGMVRFFTQTCILKASAMNDYMNQERVAVFYFLQFKCSTEYMSLV